MTYPLPASGWAGLGNPAGSLGYKYNNTAITPATPCQKVLVTPLQLLAFCKSTAGLGVPLTGTFPATAPEIKK